jgi:hypothetical protein
MYRYLYDEAYTESFEQLVFTWRDAVKAGRAYSAPYTENDMLTKMMEWGEESIYWRTEYECEFIESVSQIFNPDHIKACREAYSFVERGTKVHNCCVGVDIGKSVNSTVISVWSTEKSADGNIARLVNIEEISPKSGGHDIPYQRSRILTNCRDFGASRLIIDATGIGGAIEQEMRVACIQNKPQIHFTPFIFTGGPKGTKTQVYRDMVSYLQQGLVKIPDPAGLPANEAKLVNKWIKEHIALEYVMDTTQKTEKISAPDGKHDDYCDSTVIAIHAALGMLPPESSFSSVTLNTPARPQRDLGTKYTSGPLFSKSTARTSLKKHPPGGI